MKEKLTALFAYNDHCNRAIIKCLSTANPDEQLESTRLFNHVVNAHQIWNARIRGEAEFAIWQINAWNRIGGINDDNHRLSQEIIAQNDLSTVIRYENSKGDAFTNKLEDVLFHIINHSTYHRGQIAVALRQLGVDPPATDYIFYKRSSSDLTL